MNQLEIILIGVGGGVGVVILIVIGVYCFINNERKHYEPLEKGNVFVYERDNSNQIKEDTIMMNARFYLRSTIYSLDRQLAGIGSRIDKNYFSVMGGSTSINKQDNERVMSMVPVSTQWTQSIPLSTEAGRNTFKSIIKSLEIHPFISVPLLTDFISDKSIAVSIRPFYPKGSLRDFIHQSKPKMRYQDKYKESFQLNEKLISKFGRQILEGLSFMKLHNFPHYHLNSSNILLDDNCLISEYENTFLGLKPRLSKILLSFVEHLEPEVLSFGCILFEMACGYELESKQAIEVGIPNHCNPDVKKVLESIFKPWYGNPPTLDELIKLDFFSQHKFKNLPIARITYTTKERDMIDASLKLNKSFLSSQKVDNVPTMKGLKKQKKRKQLTFVPVEVNLSQTNLSISSSQQPTTFSSFSASYTNNMSSSVSSSLNSSLLSNSYQPTSNNNLMNSSMNSSMSNSLTSSLTTKSITPTITSGPPPPPPPPPPAPPISKMGGGPPPPPPPPPSSSSSIPPPPASSNSRKSLLSSIESFGKGALKKTKTKDRSAPKV